MHISDKLGQYNRNVANGTEELRGAQSAQKLVSTTGELSAGSVFEGTVSHIRNGKVTLALGNGQMITARLDGKVDIKQGGSMFFQVKSNDGVTVAIRPYTGAGSTGNPVLMNALTAAQIPVTERTLTMVDSMMQEQMAIDRQSILGMVKLLGNNPGANVQTIVQMTKLGLPVTEEMAAQFENYLSEHHVILDKMELALNQFADILADENLAGEDSVRLFGKLLDVFAAEGQISGEPGNGGNALMAEVVKNPDGSVSVLGNPNQTAGEASQVLSGTTGEASQIFTGMLPEASASVNGAAGQVGEPGKNAPGAAEQTLTLENVLSKEQLAALTKALQNVPTLAGNPEVFSGMEPEEIYVDTMQEDAAGMPNLPFTEYGQAEAVLKNDMPVTEFLRALHQVLGKNGEYGYAGVQKLFSGKEFKTLLKSVAEQQWLLKPEDLKEEGKTGRIYEKIERQIAQMEFAVKSEGVAQNSFLHTAADIRSNIEFMNQMNQIYRYVQMPLKMSGQNANGELYVYSNRKSLRDPDAELTAFLHLDMDHLGSTDVSVRMLKRQVKTNFYMDDDASYNLVEKHLPILEKRLKNKGYNCSITISNEKKNVNFKENFVKHGHGTSGSLQRYSFDVRA